MQTMTEILRWYVVIISVAVMITGTPHLWKRWRTYKVENQYVWLSVVLFNFATFAGTLEVLARSTPGGYRNYLFAIAETWLLVAVTLRPVQGWRARHRRKHPEEHP
jgi:hypothetical protein